MRETLPPSGPVPDVVFLPLHKRALGMATGTVAALLVFLVTAGYLIHPPPMEFNLALLGEYFTGYTVSWPGAFIGAGWAGFVGFVLGWFLAFSRNLLVGVMVVVIRSRAQIAQTRDFLDHI